MKTKLMKLMKLMKLGLVLIALFIHAIPREISLKKVLFYRIKQIQKRFLSERRKKNWSLMSKNLAKSHHSSLELVFQDQEPGTKSRPGFDVCFDLVCFEFVLNLVCFVCLKTPNPHNKPGFLILKESVN